MGHNIIGLIGAPAALLRIGEKAGAPPPTALPFDLAIIPLGETQLDRLTQESASRYDEDFIYLSVELETAIGAAAADHPLLYIETDYFGGMGGQGAALFERGTLAWKDALRDGEKAQVKSPISQGLSRLGVTAADGSDEFDALGLGHFRNMETLGLAYDDGD